MYADTVTDSMTAGDRRDRSSPREAGRVQPRERHRPAAAAQAHRRHHRCARTRGSRHRRDDVARSAAKLKSGKGKAPTPQLRRTGIAAEGADQLEATISDLSEPDARGGRRAQVRARRAAARRGAGHEEGAARHGARRPRLSPRSLRGAQSTRRDGLRAVHQRLRARPVERVRRHRPAAQRARALRALRALGGGVVS